MGFWDSISDGFKAVTGAVGGFLNDHPMIDNAISTGLGFIPGVGGAINTALDVAQSMAGAAKNDGAVKPSEVVKTLAGNNVPDVHIPAVIQQVQAIAQVPISTSPKEMAILKRKPIVFKAVEAMRRDPRQSTTTGNNSDSANGESGNWFKRTWNKAKQKWDELETWHKWAIGIGAPVVILTILGYTVLSKKKGSKKIFFGKFR